MYPHRIRLRGPWQCEPVAGAEGAPLPPPRRMTLPCRWAEGGLADFAGRVRFRRHFGYPGQIDDNERVWLTFAGVEGRTAVQLNGQRLGEPAEPRAGFEYEVTSLLRPRNELLVEVEAGADGGLWGEVALEIRRTAFLRDVRICWQEDRLEVSGEVVGNAERPLELYAVLDRSTVIYATVIAGSRFLQHSDALTLQGRHILRVDLVDGATVWYTLEQYIDLPGEQGS